MYGFTLDGIGEAFRNSPMGLQEQVRSGLGNKGDFYGMLGKILSQQLQNGVDVNQYRQTTEGAINRGYNKSRTKLKEDFAGRGTSGSGAALAALAQLGGERSNALGQNEANLQQINTQYKQNALSNLFNLNQFGANQSNFDQNTLLNLLSGAQGQEQFDKRLKFEKDSQPSWFASLLGTLLGTGSQVVGTGFATNWGKGN